MNRFELVIFDCDGVLVDSERITNTVLCTMLDELGLQLSSQDLFELLVGRSMTQNIALMTELLGCPLPADFEANFRRRTAAAFRAGIEPIEGVAVMLEELRMPFCVASNGPHEKIRLTLGLTGLLEKFTDNIFSATDVAEPKPSPDVYLLAARAYGVDPSACAVIEDTPTGVCAGVAAGMHVFGFSTNTPRHKLEESGVHHVFSDMRQLSILLQ